jgi:hypothetical protein
MAENGNGALAGAESENVDHAAWLIGSDYNSAKLPVQAPRFTLVDVHHRVLGRFPTAMAVWAAISEMREGNL